MYIDLYLFSSDRVYISPIGAQLTNVKPVDLYVKLLDGKILYSPADTKCLKQSQITPLIMTIYSIRGDGAVINTLVSSVVMATLMYTGKEFTSKGFEVSKNIKKKTGIHYQLDEEVVIPIIDNSKDASVLKVKFICN